MRAVSYWEGARLADKGLSEGMYGYWLEWAVLSLERYVLKDITEGMKKAPLLRPLDYLGRGIEEKEDLEVWLQGCTLHL